MRSLNGDPAWNIRGAEVSLITSFPSSHNLSRVPSIFRALPMTSPFLFRVAARKRKGENAGKDARSLKKRLKATVGRITGKFTNPTHFCHPPFRTRVSLSLSPLSYAVCLRSNPLTGASSFCILIPPQRGADNLGRGFFKLAPLTRYAARWVSYRNNFRALFPPNRRARSSFFPWYILFFSPLLYSTVFTAKLMELAPSIKRLSTQFN